MVIPMDFPMFDTTNAKLNRSADELESALAQLGKNVTFSVGAGDNLMLQSSDLFSAVPATYGNGFDEWLAADLQLGGLSSDESSQSSSPFSAMEDSPVSISMDSFGGMVGSSLFDMPLAFSSPEVTSASVMSAGGLTASAVQQAAAALNIPWSHDLEKAVMAQAALNAIPMSPVAGSPVLASKVEVLEKVSVPVPAAPAVAAEPAVASAVPAPPAPKKYKKRVLSPEEKQEEIVAKRAKNTDAARRSRLKKLIKVEGLEAMVSDLESSQTSLNMRIAVLETEKCGHIAKEMEQAERIAQLEAQLAEANAALTLLL